MDRCKCGHVLRLSGMARYAVQNEQVVLSEGSALQEQVYDLFCQGKVLIFEKKSALENTVNKSELLCSVIPGAFLYGYRAAELRAEIKMVTPSAEQPLTCDGVTQGAFAYTGWAQEEDGIYRVLNGHLFSVSPWWILAFL